MQLRSESFPSVHPSIHPICRRFRCSAVWIQISLMEKGNELTLVSSEAERKVVEVKSILVKDKRVIKPFSLKHLSMYHKKPPPSSRIIWQHCWQLRPSLQAVQGWEAELHPLRKRVTGSNEWGVGVALKSCTWLVWMGTRSLGKLY